MFAVDQQSELLKRDESNVEFSGLRKDSNLYGVCRLFLLEGCSFKYIIYSQHNVKLKGLGEDYETIKSRQKNSHYPTTMTFN